MTKPINQITELLRKTDLSWLLPNLRQDFVVWNGLNDPVFIDRFIQLKQAGEEFTSEEFSPGKLSLLALNLHDIVYKSQGEPLRLFDYPIIETAIRSFNDHTLFQIIPQNLATAGQIALVLAHNFISTKSWNGLLDELQDKPGSHWFTPIACLYGFVNETIGLLKSLVQPGASKMRLALAVHTVLSNPIRTSDQVEILMSLCQGAYKDLLPARERFLLVRSLFEQRPQLAADFSLRWLEIHPKLSKTIASTLNDPIEDLNQIAEILFQAEIHKIAGESSNQIELLKNGKELSQLVSKDLLIQHVSNTVKNHSDKSVSHELSSIRDLIIRPKDNILYSNINQSNQAEFALILASQGFYDDAEKLVQVVDSPLPDEPNILYSLAKISTLAGDQQSAIDRANRIVEILDDQSLSQDIPVWGENLSLVNLGNLLMDLHKPEQASRFLNSAHQICPNDASIMKSMADCYIFSHKYQEASEVLRELVSLNPENKEYRRMFAQSLETIGDWESCLQERANIVESITDGSNTLPDDLYSYAKAALYAGHPELTIKTCGDLLLENPEDCQALIYSGEAYLLSGENEKGMDCLVRATEVAPHLPEAWIALTEAQKKKYPYKTVIETLIHASQAVLDSPQIHFALGELYLLDNTPTLALPELKLAASLSPEDPQILFTYAQALRLVGHTQESRKVLSSAYHIEPAYPGLAKFYADVLIDQNELEEAIIPLEMLITTKTSQDPALYMDYARSILSLNKHGLTKYPPMNALIALNEYLQINPDNVEAKALIAETLAANGDKEMAFEAYREVLDSTLIEDKNWLERLSYGFGCVASSVGKHDIAIAAFQEASQVNPGNTIICKALSDAYIAAGLLEDAIRSARNVLVVDGDNPDNLAWFAKQASCVINIEKSDHTNSSTSLSKTLPTEAQTSLAKAIQLAPTRTDLLVQLGYFQSSIGDESEAQATLSSIASLNTATTEDLKNASSYLSEIGDHEGAIACLENSISKDMKAVEKHDASLYTKLAQEYVANNDHASAINTLNKAIETIPGDGALVSHKIEILLDLGQSIEALNCIETAVQTNPGGISNIDLLFLASRISRSIGDFTGSIKNIQKSLEIFCEQTSASNLSQLRPQFRTQVAEIYRLLIQPDQAFNIINDEPTITASDFTSEQDYLDFICLHTELALDTGNPIRPDIQDIQPESSNPSFSRLMAITARLMNKAGNYKQAEQIFQIAVNNFNNQYHPANLPNWSIAFSKYLTSFSITKTALDLGLWNQARIGAQTILESSPGEPLSYLTIAEVIVLKAEFYNLCEATNVSNHKPSIDSISKDTLNQFTKYLESAKSILNPYYELISNRGFELTDDLIYRWQARADIAFNRFDDTYSDPVEILTHQRTPVDAAALIYHLHQADLRAPDRDSITKIIKIARSYSRNPSVLLQVALAIHDENPSDAMKSLQTVLEQNPFSKNPTIAFCNILLAKIALNQEEYDIARRAVENAIEIWHDEPDWHALAAQIYQRISDTNSTICHLLEATKLDPKKVSSHLELGKVYYENAYDDTHMLKQAHLYLENVLNLDPKDVSALILLASTQYQLKDLEKAEQNAHKALILAPNRAEIYQLLSEIKIRNNDFQGAYEYANKAIQLSPKDLQSTIILARSLSALGRHSEALTKINGMLPAVTDSKSLHLERVTILRKINGVRAGLEELKTLLDSYPDDFNILTALAKTYIEVGESENAINIAQQALNACTDKTSLNEQANLHLLIGQILRQSGQLDQSINHLSQAILLAPDRLEPYLELGLARKERREYQQAIQIFEQATSIDPEDPRAPYQAGLALKESKDYKSSETMLRRAVSLAPHDLNIRRQLAAVVALNLVHNPRSGRN